MNINMYLKYTVTIASKMSYINEDGEFRELSSTNTYRVVEGGILLQWIANEIQDKDTSEISIYDECGYEIKFTKFDPLTGEGGTIWYLIGGEE